MSRICLCLTASHLKDTLRQIETHRKDIDMAELRLDLMNPEERKKALRLPSLMRALPFILTIRLSEDGGLWGTGDLGAKETEDERECLFMEALSCGGWAYVDLEYNHPMERVSAAARAAGTKIIRSIHDFNGKFLSESVSETAEIFRKIEREGNVVKLAAVCRGSRDLLSLARLGVAVENCENKVLLCMGEYGTPSRVLSSRLNSLWTYVSPPDGPQAALGQLNPESMTNLYRFRQISRNTPLYAVVGNPIAHSLSPLIHNKWLQTANLPGSYLPIRSDDMGALMETCDLWGISGLSVTVPHKREALRRADFADPVALEIGASNTLVRRADGWHALNTDVEGFLSPLPKSLSLESVNSLRGMKAAVIGAGGAARAVVHALRKYGVTVVILNRTEVKARALAESSGSQSAPLSAEAEIFLKNTDFVVQTTTLGMHPEEGKDPLPWWDFSGCSLVYDLIYHPAETLLLKRAAAAGIKTLNGLAMLEGQARAQFRLFTGSQAPLTGEPSLILP